MSAAPEVLLVWLLNEQWCFDQCPSCKDVYVYDMVAYTHHEVHSWDEEWSVDDDDTEFHFSEFLGEDFCWPCVESDNYHSSTLVRIAKETGEKSSVTFGDASCSVDYDYENNLEWFGTIGYHGRNYKRTDGWRGYHDTQFEHLTEFESGWVTGDYGDVPWKRDMHRFMQAIEDGQVIPPVDLFICFEPTSNVFSTACGLFARNDEVDTLKAWIESLDFDLHKALG